MPLWPPKATKLPMTAMSGLKSFDAPGAAGAGAGAGGGSAGGVSCARRGRGASAQTSARGRKEIRVMSSPDLHPADDLGPGMNAPREAATAWGGRSGARGGRTGGERRIERGDGARLRRRRDDGDKARRRE